MPTVQLCAGMLVCLTALAGCAALTHTETKRAALCARDALAESGWARDIHVSYMGSAVVSFSYLSADGRSVLDSVTIFRDVMKHHPASGAVYARIQELLSEKCGLNEEAFVT